MIEHRAGAGGGAPGFPGERRRYPRLPAGAGACACLHLGGGRAVGPLPVRDRSAGGLCLVLLAPLPWRAVEGAGLYDRTTGAWRTIPARGVSFRRRGGEYLMGVAFTPELTDEQLPSLLP